MKIIPFEQGSEEWLAFRRNKIGASDAPVIMEISPWKSPYELFIEKAFAEEQPMNHRMLRGKELEEDARKEFEKITGIIMQPCVVTHPENEWMIASLDGMDFDCTTFVEIKCPNKKDHAYALQGIIPEKYYPQVQHQIACTGMEKGYYFSYDGKKGALVTITRNEDYIKNMIEKEEKFYEYLTKYLLKKTG